MAAQLHTISSDTRISSSYLGSAFRDLKPTVNATAKVIRNFYRKQNKKGNKIDSIAFRGTSGSAMAYPLSYILNIPLSCVRKQTENTHTSARVEGVVNAKNYIIVDDFISSGETMRAIIAAMELEARQYGRQDQKCLGIFLYEKHAYVPCEQFIQEKLCGTPVFVVPPAVPW